MGVFGLLPAAAARGAKGGTALNQLLALQTEPRWVDSLRLTGWLGTGPKMGGPANTPVRMVELGRRSVALR